MYRILITLLCFIYTISAFSQGELDEVRVVTGNEKSYAFLLNSNGWGLNYRYGKRLDGFRKRLIDVDFSYIKHAKEIKTQNPYYENQKRFVFGKLNSMFTLRVGVGLQKEIYSKFDKGGVAIKYFVGIGFTAGILKPVYYQIVDSSVVSNNERYIYVSDKKFDESSIHQVSDIYSRSSFFKGIGETKFKPGLNVKLGLSFVYSNIYDALNAIEAGVIVDGFTKEMPIMATEKNDKIFVSLFVSYRFGRVGIKNKKSKKENVDGE
jgi:hypothetical protein